MLTEESQKARDIYLWQAIIRWGVLLSLQKEKNQQQRNKNQGPGVTAVEASR